MITWGAEWQQARKGLQSPLGNLTYKIVLPEVFLALVALLLLEVRDELCQKPTAFNLLDWMRSCLIQSVLIGFNLLFFMLASVKE
jgi:hypothetical protein